MDPLPREISDAGPAAARIYQSALANGATERFAIMVALQTPPGTRGSDRAFMEGRLNNQQLDDMPDFQAKRMLSQARSAGINPTGKVYVGGLADHRGFKDPAAWVDSTGDILRVARDRNLTVDGAVTHKGTPVPPQRKVLNERIVNEEMARYRKLHPGKKREELREMVISKHAHPLKRKEAT
jgi:hypothetical protein